MNLWTNSDLGSFYRSRSLLSAIGVAVVSIATMVVMPVVMPNRHHNLRIGWRTDRSQRKQHTQGKDPTGHTNFQGLSLRLIKTYQLLFLYDLPSDSSALNRVVPHIRYKPRLARI